jgi:hypothetical protein
VNTPSSFDYAYNIKEIRAKWSQIDDATREKALENLRSGKFIENTINDFTGALGDVADALKSITPDFLWPKASESLEEQEVHEEEIGEAEEKVDKENKAAQKDKKDSAAQQDRKTQSQKLKEQKEIEAIDVDALRLHPELAEDQGKRLLVAYTAREIEKNGLALDRQGAVEAAYMLVDNYDGKTIKVHKAAYTQIAQLGLREAIKGCASNPSCNKYVIEGVTAMAAAITGYLAKKITTASDNDKADEQSSLENERNSDYNKRTGAPKSTQVEAASTTPEGFDPDDFEPNEGGNKFKWNVKKAEDADKISRHEKFGKFYRDPSQKLGNKEIWWTRDTAHHGGTRYKLYTIRGKMFEHFADLDENGLQILKHKSEIGRSIPVKEFIGVK